MVATATINEGTLASVQDFQNLAVWQRSFALAIRIDGLVGRFGRGHANLKAQLSRAAHSIATNIVEGSGAASQREFARYLDIAIKSTSETQHHVLAAHARQRIPEAERIYLIDEISQIRRMIYGLRRRVLASQGHG